MKRVIYHCDICHKEYDDHRSMYVPTNELQNANYKVLVSRIKVDDICFICFANFESKFNGLIEELKVVD